MNINNPFKPEPVQMNVGKISIKPRGLYADNLQQMTEFEKNIVQLIIDTYAEQDIHHCNYYNVQEEESLILEWLKNKLK